MGRSATGSKDHRDDRALAVPRTVEYIAPQHVRNRPMVRQLTAGIIARRRALSEELRSLAARLGVR